MQKFWWVATDFGIQSLRCKLTVGTQWGKTAACTICSCTQAGTQYNNTCTMVTPWRTYIIASFNSCPCQGQISRQLGGGGDMWLLNALKGGGGGGGGGVAISTNSMLYSGVHSKYSVSGHCKCHHLTHACPHCRGLSSGLSSSYLETDSDCQSP